MFRCVLANASHMAFVLFILKSDDKNCQTLFLINKVKHPRSNGFNPCPLLLVVWPVKRHSNQGSVPVVEESDPSQRLVRRFFWIQRAQKCFSVEKLVI